MSSIVKVALFDPSDVSLRKTLALLDQARPELQIVNVLRGSAQLEDTLCEHSCDVLLLDDTIWNAGTISCVLNLVHLRSPETAILILSQKLRLAYIKQLFFEGIKGFIYRGDSLEDHLLPAITGLCRGELYVSPKPAFVPYRSSLGEDVLQLTVRDLKVLQLLEEGLNVREIAGQLDVEHTAVYRARNKLKDILEARINEKIVAMAYTKGLL